MLVQSANVYSDLATKFTAIHCTDYKFTETHFKTMQTNSIHDSVIVLFSADCIDYPINATCQQERVLSLCTSA